ncbi:hypothetical protein V1517DRAFT_334293 [Lipomyces orientalis]|uniref:Uncharacterized protein n=1 Tax=Lipomyces orientalis TaxID=1233043 RepID=A0ACC3TDP0_9ASCO
MMLMTLMDSAGMRGLLPLKFIIYADLLSVPCLFTLSCVLSVRIYTVLLKIEAENMSDQNLYEEEALRRRVHVKSR